MLFSSADMAGAFSVWGAASSRERVTDTVYVFVLLFSAVTITLIELLPSEREIACDSFPDVTDEPLTVIVALDPAAAGVSVTCETEYLTDAVYESVSPENAGDSVPDERVSDDSLFSELDETLVTDRVYTVEEPSSAVTLMVTVFDEGLTFTSSSPCEVEPEVTDVPFTETIAFTPATVGVTVSATVI
jgi:hypothetical protein